MMLRLPSIGAVATVVDGLEDEDDDEDDDDELLLIASLV
tara:strand:- start:130 stop:246 length:117 start_codon:yes stop_codon:yes gene_type:complete